jgi:O-antigen biosynthesis protein WbqP
MGGGEISIEEKVGLEKEYLEKKSFLFDLEIVLKTFTSVLWSKGVAH